MRLKKLFLLIVAMVMAIPTMLAQDPVFFAYGTSTGYNFKTNPLLNPGELTYNADSQTYTGTIELIQSGKNGNKTVTFYKGAKDAPTTFIGSTMSGMGTSLLATDFGKPLATRDLAFGWYVNESNMGKIGGSTTDPQPFDVTINVSDPSAPTVMFELADAPEQPAVPTDMYVYSFIGSWTQIATLFPTETGGTTFTGTVSTTLNNQSFLLNPSSTWVSGKAIGQKSVGSSGSSQTKDVTLSTPGSSTTIDMEEGTTATTIKTPGEYTFEFDYAAMSLKVTLVGVNNNIPSELRVLQGTTPSSSDIVLTRQSNGSYKGTFPVSGTSNTDVFMFYGTVAGNTVYYGYDSDLIPGALNFSTNPLQVQDVRMNQSYSGAKGWYVTQYPKVGTATNLITNGMMTVTVTLDFEAGGGEVAFNMVNDVAPKQLQLYTNSQATTSGYKYTTADAIDNRFFQWTIEDVPAGGIYVAIANTLKQNLSNTGWVSAVNQKTASATINLADGKYSSEWYAVPAANWNWAQIVPTAAGDVTIQLDMATLTVTIFEGEPVPDDNYYLHAAPLAGGPWDIAATDPVLTLGEDGFYTATTEIVKNGAVRFYTKDLFGQPNWIGANNIISVNLADGEYKQTYEPGPSPWRFPTLVNNATETTITCSVDFESNTIIFVDNTEPVAPEEIYVWASNDTDDEGNPVYNNIGTLTLSSDNILEGKVEIPAGSMFYLGESATSATFNAWKAAYENFSDAGGSSVSGTAPAVKFIDGIYEVQLYMSTTAPSGAPTTSIAYTAGGNVEMSFNYTTKVLTVTEPASYPEYLQIAYKPNVTSPITYNPETDAQLLPVEGQEGVYSANLEVTLNRAFVFYTGADAASRTTYNSSNGFTTAVTWGKNNYWPNDEEGTEEDAQIVVNKAAGTWQMAAAPGATGVYTVTVDLNTMMLSIKVAEDAKPAAPEALYLWGTTGGFEGDARYTKMGTFTKGENDVYTLDMVVPSCGVFESDAEYSPTEGDPNYGFYFFLSNNGESYTANGAYMYLAPLDNHLINLSEGTYTATLSTDKRGHNMIAVTPGLVSFTYDYNTDEFTAVMEQAYNQVQLNFTGETTYKNVTAETVPMNSGSTETPDFEPGKNGILTASGQYYSGGWQTQPEFSVQVNGTYQSNFKSLNIIGINMPDGNTSYTNPMILTIDTSNGNVYRNECLAYNYAAGMPCYYADYVEPVTDATARITGTIANTGVNECTLTLTNWGDLMYYQNKPYTWNQAKWENTKIVFNFAISDLPAFEAPAAEEPEVLNLRNELLFSYETQKQIKFEANEGYTIEITSSLEQGTTTWTVSDVPAATAEGTQGANAVLLTLYPGANGAQFDIKVSEPVAEPCSMEFTFKGSNFTLGNDINDYLTIVDQAILIGSSGEVMGDINISGNPFTYTYGVYNEAMGNMSMLTLTPKYGYSIVNVVATEETDEPKWSIQGGETGVWMIQASEVYNLPITVTLAKDPNKATFNFIGGDDAYTHVQGTDYETMENVTFTSNTYVVEFDRMGGFMSLSAKEGYEILIECATADAEEGKDYSLTGNNSNGTFQYAVVALTNGLEFNVTVTASNDVPETGVRFEFIGVENGWELFQMMDMMSDDGDYIDITGNIVDVEFVGQLPVMLGFKKDTPEDYTWTLTCENQPEQSQNVWMLYDGPMEGQHKQQMLVVYPNAYGFTFVINIEKTSVNTVNLVVTGDAAGTQATMFTKVVAVATTYDENFEETGTSQLYFTSPDETFSYEEMATLEFSLKPGNDDYVIKGITCDGLEGGDTYLISGPDIILYPGADGLTFYINVVPVSTAKEAIFVINAGEGMEGENAYSKLTATTQLYTTDFEEVGGEEALTFNGAITSFTYDEYATVAFDVEYGYIMTLTSDVNPGGDSYMWEQSSYELALFGEGENNSMMFEITISKDLNNGVTSIYDLEGNDFTVVNLQGVVILRHASAADLNLLENGMYIVNGKKIVVRK